MVQVRILSVNAGYFLGFDGTHRGYIREPHRVLRAEGKEESENMESFLHLVRSREPELVFLQEVDSGSLRTHQNQVEYLLRNLSDSFQIDFACKYRGLLRSAPVLRKLGNAVIHRGVEVRNHWLPAGRKSLVQEIVKDNFNVYSVHLATLGQWARRRQLRKLSGILEEEYIIAGDHNFHKGEKEIKYMKDLLSCEIERPGPTFPAENPDQELDLAAHSTDIDIEVKKLGNSFSDHQPIEIQIN